MTGGLQSLLSGVGRPRVNITDQSVSKVASGHPATATYTVANTGNVTKNGAGFVETWLLSGTVDQYDVRATQISGDAIADGVWYNLLSSHSYSLSANIGQDLSGVILVEIRDTLSLAVLDSATITLSASSA